MTTSDSAGRRSAWSWALELAEQTPESRNRYVDFLRAASITVVVLGHWLMAAPSMAQGELTIRHMLEVAPWMQWLTWVFQVMPLFFIVGGYSNSVSLESARAANRTYGEWLGSRLKRLIAPIVPLVVVWTAIAFGAQYVASPDTIRVGSQAALIPTWFLAVYIMVCVVAPVTHDLWRRFGMASFWGLVFGAVCIDAIAFSRDLELLRWVNYAFVWLAVHHMGYMWRSGKISGVGQSLMWAAGGFAALLALVVLAGYPVAMLSVPGAEVSNSRPPTLALLALAITHGGLALAFEAPARRWLHSVRPWAATVLVNGTIMTVYLWHVTAMVLIVGLAYVLGGIGLDLEPGSSAWWATRPLWFGITAAFLALFVAVFGRFEQSSRAAGAAPLQPWQAIFGAMGVCFGLAALALGGIGAAGPPGVRVWTVGMILVGAGLATGRSLRRGRSG